MDYFDALRCDNKTSVLSSRDNFTVLKTPKEEFLFEELEELEPGTESELLAGFRNSPIQGHLEEPLRGVSKLITVTGDDPKKLYWVLAFINHPTPKIKKTTFVLSCGQIDL